MTDEQALSVRYDAADVRYAAQFVVQASSEELILNFAAGQIEDGTRKLPVLPVHTRIALTPSGAQRLIATLQNALAQTGHGARRASTTEARVPGLGIEVQPPRS